MSETRVIKKYPNRRLYDTVESRYITLADIRRLVTEKVEFVVIEFVTVGFGVADEVEPVPGPALAVVRGGEQAFHNSFEGLRRLVGEKGIHFGGRGRLTGEIEGDAADEGA